MYTYESSLPCTLVYVSSCAFVLSACIVRYLPVLLASTLECTAVLALEYDRRRVYLCAVCVQTSYNSVMLFPKWTLDGSGTRWSVVDSACVVYLSLYAMTEMANVYSLYGAASRPGKWHLRQGNLSCVLSPTPSSRVDSSSRISCLFLGRELRHVRKSPAPLRDIIENKAEVTNPAEMRQTLKLNWVD